MDSFVKFVFGGNNGSGTNGATRIQIGHNTSLVGGETNTNTLASMFDAAALTAAGYADYNALLADIETVVLAIEVDRSGATKTLKGLWTFENVAEAEIFSGETIVRTIIIGQQTGPRARRPEPQHRQYRRRRLRGDPHRLELRHPDGERHVHGRVRLPARHFAGRGAKQSADRCGRDRRPDAG